MASAYIWMSGLRSRARRAPPPARQPHLPKLLRMLHNSVLCGRYAPSSCRRAFLLIFKNLLSHVRQRQPRSAKFVERRTALRIWWRPYLLPNLLLHKCRTMASALWELSFIFCLLILKCTAQCYLPGGDLAPHHKPCQPHAYTSLCCPPGWTCFDNNLCIVTDVNGPDDGAKLGSAARGACENPIWNDTACGDFCLSLPASLLAFFAEQLTDVLLRQSSERQQRRCKIVW